MVMADDGVIEDMMPTQTLSAISFVQTQVI